MPVQTNQAHRNAILDATGAVFNAGTIQIRDAARSGADAAAPGNLLATVTIANPAFAASAGGGPVASAAQWSGSVSTTGAPLSFRTLNTGATQVREGDAAEAPGAGEAMLIDGLVGGDLIQGGQVTIAAGDYTIAQPAGPNP